MVFFISDMIGITLWGLFLGMATSGILVAREVMMGDVIDDDEVKTGLRREGSYFGFMIMIEKLSLVIVGLFAVILLDTIIGYNPSLPDPPHMDISIRIGMVVIVGIFTLILIAFLQIYPLTKEKVAEIREKVEKLHAEKREHLEKIEKE